MVRKHIAGKWEYEDLSKGDKVVDKDGKLLTGKGKSITLDNGYVLYRKNNQAEIRKKDVYSGNRMKMILSKDEILFILKNFKYSKY